MNRSESLSGINRREFLKRARRPVDAGIEDGFGTRRPDSKTWRASAMRTPRAIRSLGPTKAVEAPPEAAVIALNRMGFGPRPGDIEAFRALGSTDEERMLAYVNQQVSPELISDPECDGHIAQGGFQSINKSQAQLWQDYVESGVGWSQRMRPFFEIERLTFLRAVFSKRQLLEVMADFWHNHFNVYGYDYWSGPLWPYYDRDVIRGNAFGNFRQMLGAVAQSPCMLYYLDNYTSSNAGPNENYAREMVELHTMGAENYLGVMRQNDVPLDGEGYPIGYVDDDVFEITRCFTGWSFDFDTGLFEYRSDWHDNWQKNVLNTFLPANQAALQDGNDVLDALAYHPGTARHIAGKLCRRLVSDDPPQSLVDTAANIFYQGRYHQFQLYEVVRTILLSDEFLETWGEKIKRPFEVTVGMMRAAHSEFSFAYDHDRTDDMLWYYDQCGQPLFSWRAPNGYSDFKEDWQSASPRVFLFRLCNWLADVEVGDNHLLRIFQQTPGHLRTANELVDYWIERALGRPMSATDRTYLVDFMSQGYNPDFDLPVDNDWETQERLRAMVALIFMSPSYLWR